MPAGIRFRAAEMSQRLLFLFRGHLRSLACVKADENNFVVAAGIEAEHAESADDALLDLIAKHGRSRLAGVAWNSLRVQSERRDQERRDPHDMPSFIHSLISFSPSRAQESQPNPLRR